jgi:hypothetical protein
MSQVSTDNTEVYRVRVPNPATELTLGQDERGFRGVHLRTDVHSTQMYGLLGAGDVSDTESELALGELNSGYKGFVARVGSGSAFLAAGGGAFGLSRFEDFGHALTGISLGIGGVMAAAGLVERMRFASENTTFSLALTGVKLAAQATLEGLAIGSHGIPKGAGSVAVYGDTSVSVLAPASASVTALGLASLSAGVAATVGGMVYSGLGGGLMTGVSGLLSSSMGALKVSMFGDDVATVAARHGEVRLEGKKVLVGSPSVGLRGLVRGRGFISTKQEATTHVQVDADDEILISAGKPPLAPHAPTKLRATPQGMRLESTGGAVTLDSRARVFAGQSLAEFGPRGITLTRMLAPAKAAYDAAVTAAEASYTAAIAAADAAQDTSASAEQLLIAGVAGGLVGTIAAAAALGATRTSDAGTVVGGIAGGGLAGGAAVGTLGTLAVVKLVKTLAANKARDLAVMGADALRKGALAAAAQVESTALGAATSVPATPKIMVKDDCIVMSVGLTKVTIHAAGITVSAPAGQVKVSALSTQLQGTVNQVG